MLIALLVLLGVNLVVIAAFVTIVAGRRRWLSKQPGAFLSAIRVTNGEVNGIPSTWKRGTGRWVRDVLVWSKAPFLFRTHLIPVDRVSDQREAQVGDVKRLGDHPVVIEIMAGDAKIELAARAESSALVIGPFTVQTVRGPRGNPVAAATITMGVNRPPERR
jgi:Protein of unknown function (DUF2550)